jgi:Flp pilus assembly pilin Flp
MTSIIPRVYHVVCSSLSRLWSDQEGLVTVEYALLLALMVVAALSTWTTFGAVVRTKVATAGNAINGIQ